MEFDGFVIIILILVSILLVAIIFFIIRSIICATMWYSFQKNLSLESIGDLDPSKDVEEEVVAKIRPQTSRQQR